MSKGMSLHIGLNSVDPSSYEGWDGQLVACENDANSMQEIASSLGYTTKKLLTKEAARETVIKAISDAASTLASDDIFFLTYSGHGGQVPDTNGDEPDDHKDETWVLYNGEMVDDELYELYTKFKAGTRIVVLSDSCHSGTVTKEFYRGLVPLETEFRGPRPVSRFKLIDRAIQDKVIARHKKMFDDIQDRTKAAVRTTPAATILLISGCQDNQLSSDGDVNGLFTEKLLTVWNNGKYKNAYRNFQKTIKQHMPPTQTPKYFVAGAPNRDFEQQRPFTIESPRAMGLTA